MSLLIVLIANVFTFNSAFANTSLDHTRRSSSVLVLETKDTMQPEHAQTVLSLACPKADLECRFEIVDFKNLTISNLNKTIENSDIINMSFGYESPYDSEHTKFKYQALIAQGFISQDHVQNFNDRKKLFETLFKENSEKLFVVPAGNGSDQHILERTGVPLGSNYLIYPAILEFNNLIKVTAVNASYFNKNYRMIYQIADYANYSIDHIDVAAPVASDNVGSSYAVPYASKLADEINESFSLKLSPSELKNIFQKSCYIQDIKMTLDHFKAYKNNREESVINKIQNTRLSLREREALVKSISPVMLVKCGGVLSNDQALHCAKNYIESNKTKSILDSCLESYAEEFYLSDGEAEKLKDLWSL